jgi:hypothetical protein
MSSRELKQVERMNDEFFGYYQRLRDGNMKRGTVIRIAAEMQGYGLSRAYKIVSLQGKCQ